MFVGTASETLRNGELTFLTVLCTHWLAIVTCLKLAGYQEAQLALLVAFEEMVRRVKEESGVKLHTGPATQWSDRSKFGYQLCFLGKREHYTPASDGLFPINPLTFRLPDERT